MEYGIPEFCWADPHVLAGACLLASIIACGFLFIRKKPVVGFGCLWFVVTLLPVSNIVPINAYMAEHWLYLPSMGFFSYCCRIMVSDCSGCFAAHGQKDPGDDLCHPVVLGLWGHDVHPGLLLE
jgi:hypothetical protein